MHTEVIEFVKTIKSMFPEQFKGVNVLEAGSLDLNGSVRRFFNNCYYVGLDLAPGKGVDVVCPAHQYSTNIKFDVVITTEMLEHDKDWKLSLRNMYDLLREGGLFVMTCAGPERPEHGTARTSPSDSPFTNDYYRNISHADFFSVLEKTKFKVFEYGYKRGMQDFVFWGIKK